MSRLDHLEISCVKILNILLCMNRNKRHSSYYCKSNPNKNIGIIIYIKTEKNILKMNKEVRMLLPKKDLIQVEYIGKINNYYEDIYIPPYNNTD